MSFDLAIVILLTISCTYAKSVSKCPDYLQKNSVMAHPTSTKYYICLESGFLGEMDCPQDTEFDSHRMVNKLFLTNTTVISDDRISYYRSVCRIQTMGATK